MAVKKGDKFIAYGDERPASRLYMTVTRAAKDGSWVDIQVQTWAVAWTKRMKTKHFPPDGTERADWDARDLATQERDHMAMLRETGVLS